MLEKQAEHLPKRSQRVMLNEVKHLFLATATAQVQL
jgi:hypothetical protein